MKKYLILITFAMFFNLRNCYADDNYYFKAIYDKDEILLFNLCIDETGGCEFICKDKDKEGNDISYTGGIEGKSNCDAWGGLEKYSSVYLKKEQDLPALKTKLQSITCAEGTNCYKFVKETYCNNWTNNEKICNDLKTLENKPVSDDEENIECSVEVSLREVDETLRMRIISNNDGSLLTYPVDNNTNLIIEQSEFYGYSNKFYWYSKGSTYEEFAKNYRSKLIESNTCPKVTFCLADGQKIGGNYTWYAELNDSCDTSKYSSGISQTIDGDGITSGFILKKEETNYGSLLIDKDDIISIIDCEQLLGGDDKSDDLIKMLKTIVGIIRIGIPILLIVLGSLDFAKAIFSSSEDEMKKSQSKFLKRLIIGVGIFLVPPILKLLLTIANGIWGNISPDFCGIL